MSKRVQAIIGWAAKNPMVKAIAGIVAFLAALATIIGVAIQIADRPENATPVEGSGNSAYAEPYRFLTQGDPPKPQGCPGLLGICLGQPIEVTRGFSSPEIEGSPQKDVKNPDRWCHQWDPPRLGLITVCEEAGVIKSIALSPTDAPAMLSLPNGLAVSLPIKMSELTSKITRKLGNRPYYINRLDGEGNWLDKSAWHPIGAGDPSVIIEVSGEVWTNDYQPEECNYVDHLKAFKDTTVKTIEVREPGDNEMDPCPGTQ
jgi:hypothetical protein